MMIRVTLSSVFQPFDVCAASVRRRVYMHRRQGVYPFGSEFSEPLRSKGALERA